MLSLCYSLHYLANSPICMNSTPELNHSAVSDCCSDCLGIGNDNYNIMYSLMYIFSIGSALVAGWSVDKFGHKMLIVFCCISIVAYALIAAAGIVQRSSVLVLILLFSGSVLWGCSFMPVMSLRSKIVGFWFRDKELFLAFGIASSINRSSSILAFLLTELIREKIGLQLTLWLTPIFAILSTVCAVCANVIDAAALNKMGITDQVKQENSSVRLSDILHLNKLIWPLLIGVATIAASYYSLMENSVQMVHQKFGFTKQSAAMISGCLEYLGIVTFIVCGLIVDRVGRPALFLLFASSLIIVMSLLLAFTSVHPIVAFLGFGLLNSFYTTAGTGSVMSMVPTSSGGIVSAMQGSAECSLLTASHFIAAAILGHRVGASWKEMQLRWTGVLLLIFGLGLLAFAMLSLVTVVSFVQQNALVSASSRSRSENYERIEEKVTQSVNEEKVQ